MDLLPIAIVIIVTGVLLLLANKYIPMDGKVKTILNWAVVIILILWLVKASGVLGYLRGIHI